MDIAQYLEVVRSTYATGHATEHSYRAALQGLFQSIDPAIEVVNEPKRSEGGMPDFLFQRDGIAFGWAEAKDIDKDVIKLKGYSVEQRKRYENAYPNLIYTNGVDFEFIRNKEVVHHTSIADFMGDLGGLNPRPEQFDELERQLRLFAEQKPVSIRSAQKLAEMMAGKAAIIKDEVGIALKDDPDFQSALGRQFTNFKDNLLPNLTPPEFADIYAETITYGMFAARLHDDTLDTFSRQEALEKLPKSNPFLRGLFQYVAGYDIPDRLRYIVDDLAEVLRASDPHSLFADFGKFTARNDPFIHFYETFLAAYNPAKRKARGVWYTPEPVVDFIVRAVDDVLKTEFGIADGLADTGKVTVDWDTGETDRKGKPVTIKKDVHRVQILDPATGTGTFLAKAVQTIADRVKARAPGKWSSYVEQELLPRLHGFELLMASYAMCHMKLDMQLTESGYVPSEGKPPTDWPAGKQWPPRLSVWLTNALEPGERDVPDLFFQQLADEARGASEVKRQTPIMCVIGNPPYSGHSSNFGEWIESLMADYKVSPELKRPAQAKWLSDDYVKFIRMAENTISKNGHGVLGFVTNHAYLDNPTFLDMRNHLRKTFDTIYVVDLHGNSKRKEICPDGSSDKNVFDIQQGVAIIVAIKRINNKVLEPEKASIKHIDFWGKREEKYKALRESALSNLRFLDASPASHPWRFKPTDTKLEKIYQDGISTAELFSPNGRPAPGIVTTQDQFAISWDAAEAVLKVAQLLGSADEQDARRRFRLCSTTQWDYLSAKKDLTVEQARNELTQISYRPFDNRWTIYNSHVAVHRRERVMSHFYGHQNLGLATARSNKNPFPDHFFLTDRISETKFAESSTQSVNFPLYLYPDERADQADALAPTTRTLNLDAKLYAAICKIAGIDPANTAGPDDDFRSPTADARPSEIKVFDYIYGVLHSPDYRETFAEFLKVDFPRIPYPASPELFRHVSEKGEQLRRLHLMEPAAIGDVPFPFMNAEGAGPDEANDEVAPAHPKYKDGRVYINPHQYFADVPQAAWDFYIGGYQPAQKWLKDRKGRALSWDDIGHYQNIVKILIETDRIMKEIVLPLETDAAEG
ncbi:type ISP restriction/modification enzyme [Novosphingopyxis sp. YJ-S2-01]|uniref:type ISP restriction/modification enzyme n=1 Tax=Novosphingopyxis sp. YJ-S2-01 TaxID=2794021 RepID=UPI0018DE93E8|nr:type ISP restriction/modification enzyme [Novosphingopyxis sp. YJ-S2-01]MBH9536242.1 N-6 DNA methylase [Novosphingopyxis sp. YJ-S2-01]